MNDEANRNGEMTGRDDYRESKRGAVRAYCRPSAALARKRTKGDQLNPPDGGEWVRACNAILAALRVEWEMRELGLWAKCERERTAGVNTRFHRRERA
jgi:hypothetical protein